MWGWREGGKKSLLIPHLLICMRPVSSKVIKVLAAHCSARAKVKAICLQGHYWLYNLVPLDFSYMPVS